MATHPSTAEKMLLSALPQDILRSTSAESPTPFLLEYWTPAVSLNEPTACCHSAVFPYSHRAVLYYLILMFTADASTAKFKVGRWGKANSSCLNSKVTMRLIKTKKLRKYELAVNQHNLRHGNSTSASPSATLLLMSNNWSRAPSVLCTTGVPSARPFH